MIKKIKMTELEWFESDTTKGDQRGLSVDFKKGMITTFNGLVLPAKEYNEDVMWVITNNIEFIKEKIDRFDHKLSITEETRIPIKDGYKLLEPLEGDQRERYSERVKEMTEELVELNLLEEKWTKK